MSANETIHVSDTGGQKAGNLERYDLIPVEPLEQLARFYGSDEHAQPGSFDDLVFHLQRFWGGSDRDNVNGFHPLVMVAFNAFQLASTEVGYYQLSDDTAEYAVRYSRIPGEPLRLLAQHYGVGAKKYEDDNWRRGYDWGLSYAALNRHLWAHWTGETVDAETGSLHLIAVAWHAFTLLWFVENKPGFDTRPSTKAKAVTDLLAELSRSYTGRIMAIPDVPVSREFVPGYVADNPPSADTVRAWQERVAQAAAIFRDAWNIANNRRDPFEDNPPSRVEAGLKAVVAAGLLRLPAPTSTPDPAEYRPMPCGKRVVWNQQEATPDDRAYIAGPMTGYPEHNYPAFATAARQIRASGVNVTSPAELHGDDTSKAWEYYLRRDIRALLNCNAVYMLDGWSESPGAQLEHHVARALRMTITYPIEETPKEN